MLSQQAIELLQVVEECHGAEIHRDEWPIAEELEAAGAISLGNARGPERAWKRAYPVSIGTVGERILSERET